MLAARQKHTKKDDFTNLETSYSIINHPVKWNENKFRNKIH